jgi:N-acyl-D-aspartate/D-glutamate deacylase
MPDLDLIKQEEQGVRDRRGRFARGRSGNPAGRPRGFHDRGRLMPGKRADLNLVGFDRLCLRALEVVNDLPAGGKRLVQRAEGYTATLVAGTPIFEHGEHTGARPPRASGSITTAFSMVPAFAGGASGRCDTSAFAGQPVSEEIP